ncbi:MAG: cysteine desulfurase family protein [Chthonomonadales bacterium]
MALPNLPVYLDYAATTPVAPEVWTEMVPFFSSAFANPASVYTPALEVRQAVEDARRRVAEAIGADPGEIFFTSGGTEADNWAVKGCAEICPEGKRHALVSSIEHKAVLEPFRWLAGHGFDVEFLPVDACGFVDPGAVARRLRADTFLVSVMHANNEVGTIQPIDEIAVICRDRGVIFHTDAVQTLGKIPLDVRSMPVDLVSLSAHKIYGPKGVGALFIRRGMHLPPLHHGGEQEHGLRAGTLNVPAIVGFGAAASLARREMKVEAERLARLRNRLIEGVLAGVPEAALTGSRTQRLPNNAHFIIEGVEGEALLLALDAMGVCASAGSACTAGSNEPSHVLLAMGLGTQQARGALRVTLGRPTTEADVDYAVEAIVRAAAELSRLRRPSAAGWKPSRG